MQGPGFQDLPACLGLPVWPAFRSTTALSFSRSWTWTVRTASTLQGQRTAQCATSTSCIACW